MPGVRYPQPANIQAIEHEKASASHGLTAADWGHASELSLLRGCRLVTWPSTHGRGQQHSADVQKRKRKFERRSVGRKGKVGGYCWSPLSRSSLLPTRPSPVARRPCRRGHHRRHPPPWLPWLRYLSLPLMNPDFKRTPRKAGPAARFAETSFSRERQQSKMRTRDKKTPRRKRKEKGPKSAA